MLRPKIISADTMMRDGGRQACGGSHAQPLISTLTVNVARHAENSWRICRGTPNLKLSKLFLQNAYWWDC
jgi:hypothetical protein